MFKKDHLDGLNNRMEVTEERVSELKDKLKD